MRVSSHQLAVHVAGPLDAKLLPGGLVDLEFAVHTVQLDRRAGFDHDLSGAIAELAGQGLMPDITEPMRLLTRLLVTLRLVAPDAAEPDEASRALIARAVGAANAARPSTRRSYAASTRSQRWSRSIA